MDEFTDLIDAELQFGVVLTWLHNQLENREDRYELLGDLVDNRGAPVGSKPPRKSSVDAQAP
ncbi:hypothetical protein ACFL1X_05975 [Candidatus Hydrogenedentota bacterium]